MELNINTDSLKKMPVGSTGNIEVLVKAVRQSRASNGNYYQSVKVRDICGDEAVCQAFDVSLPVLDRSIVAVLTLNVGVYQDAPSYKVLGYVYEPEKDISVYKPLPAFDQKAYWEEAKNAVSTLGHRPDLASLCRAILGNEDIKKKMFTLPLDTGYMETGGILRHTVDLLRDADMAAVNAGLDRDLCVASALLYDIGKIFTLDEFGAYLPEHDLVGPETLAAIKVQDAQNFLVSFYRNKGNNEMADYIENSRSIMFLKHILQARQGGKKPVIAEALLLRDLDRMVCELSEIRACTAGINPGQVTINRNLFFNRVYKTA